MLTEKEKKPEEGGERVGEVWPPKASAASLTTTRTLREKSSRWLLEEEESEGRREERGEEEEGCLGAFPVLLLDKQPIPSIGLKIAASVAPKGPAAPTLHPPVMLRGARVKSFHTTPLWQVPSGEEQTAPQEKERQHAGLEAGGGADGGDPGAACRGENSPKKSGMDGRNGNYFKVFEMARGEDAAVAHLCFLSSGSSVVPQLRRSRCRVDPAHCACARFPRLPAPEWASYRAGRSAAESLRGGWAPETR